MNYNAENANAVITSSDRSSEYWFKEWIYLCAQYDVHIAQVESAVNQLLLQSVREKQLLGVGVERAIIPFMAASTVLSDIVVPTLEHICGSLHSTIQDKGKIVKILSSVKIFVGGD